MEGTGLYVVLGVLYACAIGLGYFIYRKTFRKRIYPDGIPPAIRSAQRRLSLFLLAYTLLLLAVGGSVGWLTNDWVAGVGAALGVMVVLPLVTSAAAQFKRNRSASG